MDKKIKSEKPKIIVKVSEKTTLVLQTLGNKETNGEDVIYSLPYYFKKTKDENIFELLPAKIKSFYDEKNMLNK